MKSRIYQGEVKHSRLTPLKYHFDYAVYYYCIDLDELDELDQNLSFFGYNRINVVAIHDRDYLTYGNESIREKAMALLEKEGLAKGVKRIELITCARYFNYVFNPVSFYYCYDENDALHCVITEINNTFGEKHVYLLHQPFSCKPEFKAHYKSSKEFHVSPFRDMQEDYDYQFSEAGEKLDIRLNMIKSNKIDFLSQLSGNALALTGANLWKTLLKYPLTASLTMPRILWQAAKLHYLKKLPVITKPHPKSNHTLRVKPSSILEKVCMKMIKGFFQKFKKGHFEVRLPNHEIWYFGQTHLPVSACIQVKTYAFFKDILFGTDIAFGEAYVRGDWITPDLTRVIQIFAENRDFADDLEMKMGWMKQAFHKLWHKRRANTLKGSRDNIAAHYDLSNKLFKMFLDPTMTYSCALFDDLNDVGDVLEKAQKNKLQTMIQHADIKPEDHVLEIGSGWGSFAIEAARITGCRVTSITVSKEQFKLATQRVAEAGLSDRVEILFCDYRKITGQFDKVVSIEMIEAVGEEFLGEYFKTIERVLKPGGVLALQAITIADKRYDLYRNSCDWIKKYIFPGSLIPSLAKLDEVISKETGLIIRGSRNIGPHYARTLQIWLERFKGVEKELKMMGYDGRFQRMWEYYLSYSEAGFRNQVLAAVQFRIEKPLAVFSEVKGAEQENVLSIHANSPNVPDKKLSHGR